MTDSGGSDPSGALARTRRLVEDVVDAFVKPETIA
jgi:hypothetical protein